MSRYFKFLLFFVLVSVQVFGQSVVVIKDTTFYPRISSDYKTTYRQIPYAVRTPSAGINPAKKYGVVIILHGIGERNTGRFEDLQNIVEGFSYGGSTRMYAIPTADYNTAINKYDFIGVVPSYADNFSVSDFNYLLDDLSAKYNIDTTRRVCIAFSLGGGALVRYITSSVANAKRLSVAVAAAPVNWATNWQNVATAGLQFIGITAENDPTVSSSNIKGMVDALKKLNPPLQPFLVVAPGTGHGGFSEAQSLYHPLLPQNIYEYMLATSTLSRKQYPTTATPPPVVVQPGAPVIRVEPVEPVTATGVVTLKGCASTDYDGFTWTVTSVPKGASLWAPYMSSGGYCQSSAKFTIEGAYTIVAKAWKGSQVVTDTIVVTYQKSTTQVPLVVKEYLNGNIYFTNNTYEPGIVTGITADKKVTVKTNGGMIYEF